MRVLVQNEKLDKMCIYEVTGVEGEYSTDCKFTIKMQGNKRVITATAAFERHIGKGLDLNQWVRQVLEDYDNLIGNFVYSDFADLRVSVQSSKCPLNHSSLWTINIEEQE